MNPPRQTSFPDTHRPAGELPLEPILVLSLADAVPDVPPLPGRSVPPPLPPVLDALPVLPPLPVRPSVPPLPEPILDALPVRAPWTVWGLARAFFAGIYRAVEWAFGLVTLIAGLAFLAAIPLVGFLSLGYLLEAGGRIARNAPVREALVRRRVRWRISRFFLGSWLALNDGIIGVRKAARVGRMVLGVALMVLPVQFLSSLYASAQVIDPDGPATRRWGVGLTWLTAVVGIHIALACLHGGRLRDFFWPVGNLIWLLRRLPGGRFYSEPRDALWNFVGSLRLPYYFWLGARGFFGALAWLAVPITLMAIGRQVPPLGLLGAWYFALLLLVLPFLQMQFAAQDRFRALFELGGVLRRFSRAPLAFALAQFVTLLLSLPLYFFKIEIAVRDVGGIPSLFFVLACLVFIVFIYPTRLCTGWAYACAERRERARNPFFIVTGLLLMIPGTAFYVGFVWLTQFVSQKGFASLYEQHPFLLPIPG